MAEAAGVAHVGLGSGLDGIDCSPQRLDSAAGLNKILVGSLRRVFGEVEKLAKPMQSETNREKRIEVSPAVHSRSRPFH